MEFKPISDAKTVTNRGIKKWQSLAIMFPWQLNLSGLNREFSSSQRKLEYVVITILTHHSAVEDRR